MKTNSGITKKCFYVSPMIERIKLDNQISLQLISDAPEGPGESYLKAPEYFNNDPFKSNLG